MRILLIVLSATFSFKPKFCPIDRRFSARGGGATGLTVASGAAQLGAKTLLVEKEEMLGGDCLHYGCVPSRTLIKTAHVYHLIKNGPASCLPAIIPPPVDFKEVSARIKKVIGVIQRHDSVELFCRLGAKVEFGSPSFTDEHTITLGAGPIAIEMAQAFGRLGTKVTVVQRSGQILSKEDQDMAAIVQQALEDEGIIFQMNAAVVSTRDLGREREVLLKLSDGATVTLRAEAVLVALGRTPNIAGLGLEKIDIPFDQKGIKVNIYLRTSHNHIYAAGDVIGGYQFTHVAWYEGGVVLSNAIFHLPKKPTTPMCPGTPIPILNWPVSA